MQNVVAQRPESPQEQDGQPVALKPLYDGNFLLVLVSQTCFVIAHAAMAHYARWVEFLGGSLNEVGAVMGVGAAGGLLFRPWIAQWINRFGARVTWAIGYVLFSLSAFANLLLTDVGVSIFVLRTMFLLGAAVVFSSSLTYISQTTPEGRRTEAIGVLGVGGFLGMMIGPFLGDVFLGAGARSFERFYLLFCLATFANLVPLGVLWFLRAPPRTTRVVKLKVSEFIATCREYWPGPILLIDFTFGVCLTAPFVFVASFIDEKSIRLSDISTFGVFFLAYGAIAIVVRIYGRSWPARFGEKSMLVVGLSAVVFGLVGFGFVSAERPLLLLLPALLLGFGHGMVFHNMTSLTLHPFPGEVRGTASALALMMLDLGTLVGAPILGLIGESFGFFALFSCLAIFCIVSTSLYLIFDRSVVGGA